VHDAEIVDRRGVAKSKENTHLHGRSVTAARGLVETAEPDSWPRRTGMHQRPFA
jgi:hypothetical protein